MATEYFRIYHPVDEHLPRLRKLPDSKLVSIGDLFSEAVRKTSLTYNEGLPRFEMQNGLNVRLDGPYGSRIVWGIADPVDSWGWRSSRVDMVARVLPHLRQYVRVRSALARSECARHVGHRAARQHPRRRHPARPARADRGGERQGEGVASAETTDCPMRAESCTPLGRRTTPGSRSC